MSKKHFIGGIWPVVQRELREGARRPVNHRLRFLSAVVGTVLLWIVVARYDDPVEELGGYLLVCLHSLVLLLIFVIVPGLTADCIAREKREGTLGLLFLTPLKAGGIVAGKALVGALRAFTLWLAVVPILIIPFIAGGVTWFDVLSAVTLEFGATVLCLAAGLLASALARKRNTAFVLAYGFAGGFLLLFSQLFTLILAVGYRGFSYLVINYQDWRELWIFTDEVISMFLGTSFAGRSGGWNELAATPGLSRMWELLCLATPLVTLVIFYYVGRFAAHRINRSWQDKVPSARRESLLRRYCTPLFQRRFRRKMQRTLDWNPIAWLQQYSWKARVSKWGLCLAFLLVECSARYATWGTRDTLQMALLLTLAGIYTFAGVSGFLEEKRSGALELLLVTPIPVNKLIFGRVWGLWIQFLPAGLILAGFFLCDQWQSYRSRDLMDGLEIVLVLTCLFLTLPVFATYFALRVKNLIVAAVLTWVALWIPGCFVLEAFADVGGSYDAGDMGVMLPLVFLSYLAFALLACFLLRHSLSRRIYSF